jgi:GR25 family glycosyltransferase involved in LPS biosynthesis
MKTQVLLLWILVIGFIGFFFYRMFSLNGPARIDDIWVINLDRAPDRWEHMRKSTAQFGDMVHRFPAMDGKTITDREQVRDEGVGLYFTRVAGKDKELVNKGVVGCWLSHKRLLQHLAAQERANGYGHLILEDDAHVPKDFLSGNDTWSKISKYIPADWDMVYLGMGGEIESVPVADGLVRLVPGRNQYGTHAYLVKHGSIKTKLLPALRFMTDAIDNQYNSLFHDMNVYCVNPNIIVPDEEVSAKSTILAIH